MFVRLRTLFIIYHMLTLRELAAAPNPAAYTIFILFLIMIIMHYYKIYFLCINNIRRHATSNGWLQPQIQQLSQRARFSNISICNDFI